MDFMEISTSSQQLPWWQAYNIGRISWSSRMPCWRTFPHVYAGIYVAWVFPFKTIMDQAMAFMRYRSGNAKITPLNFIISFFLSSPVSTFFDKVAGKLFSSSCIYNVGRHNSFTALFFSAVGVRFQPRLCSMLLLTSVTPKWEFAVEPLRPGKMLEYRVFTWK